MEVLYRVLGGGKPRARTPGAEQEEADLYVTAVLLWDLHDALHYLPQRIAGEVAKLFTKQ